MQAVRLAPEEVAGAVAAVRAFMCEHAAPIASWWLCERSTPVDVEERLLALGVSRNARDYELDGMVLTHAPPPGPADVEARRAETPNEYAAVRLLQYEVFDSPLSHRRAEDELRAEFASGRAQGATYGAWLDGRLAAAARAFAAPQGAVLAGGATLPWARGRGCYRALVRARWDDVAARGGGLTVQAGAMSAPILRRLGFETVHRFHRLEDVRAAT